MPAPRLTVYACAAVLAAAVSYGLLRMPLQLHDAVEEIMAADRSPGVWASFTSTIGETAYFRPLRIAETKLLFDLSGGHYFAAYKTFHIALLVAAFALFVALLPIETWTDAAAALFALTVFAGLHTFLGLVREAFPINHFLQVAVLVLVAVHLSRARPRTAVDVAANIAFVLACLTLESGVLVWVAAVASRLAGRRGISDRGLVVMTALLAAYGVVRFMVLAPHVQAMANASGYFFERLEGPEIRARFGAGLSRFSVYNVLASIATVLFSEPRGGVFVFFRALSLAAVPPRMWINIVSSTLTTLLIGVAVSRRTERRGPFGSAVLILAAVLVASAAASFAYAKDEIMSAAGVFYALVAFWAVRELLARNLHRAAAALVSVLLLVAGSGWAIRTIGVAHVLRTQAFTVRNDWAEIPEAMEKRGTWPTEPSTQQLVLRLRDGALRMPVVNPWFIPRWADRVFDGDYF
ncbi:MAG: hypothetical protein DMF88_00620 [Acidobacteria bacterium]|nr:MAG: hypothetical protein DMF88_00620 [Acidobacteriota bacterium]